MKKFLLLGFLVLVLTACTGAADNQQATRPSVTIYKSPT